MLIPSVIWAVNSESLCAKSHKNETCGGQYSFACRSQKCAYNKEACDYFKHLGFSLSTFYTSLKTQQNKLKTYHKFVVKLNTCPAFKKQWKLEDVCLKRVNCFSFIFYAMFQSEKLKLRECKCFGIHSYQCGKSFCTHDKNGCDRFRVEAGLNRIKLKKIKRC